MPGTPFDCGSDMFWSAELTGRHPCNPTPPIPHSTACTDSRELHCYKKDSERHTKKHYKLNVSQQTVASSACIRDKATHRLLNQLHFLNIIWKNENILHYTMRKGKEDRVLFKLGFSLSI